MAKTYSDNHDLALVARANARAIAAAAPDILEVLENAKALLESDEHVTDTHHALLAMKEIFAKAEDG